MFSRKGFMGQARWAGPVYRPAAVHHRLGGMVEDYQNEINTLKEKLQRLGPGPYMQPAPVSLLPPPPPPPPPTPVFPPSVATGGYSAPGTPPPPGPPPGPAPTRPPVASIDKYGRRITPEPEPLPWQPPGVATGGYSAPGNPPPPGTPLEPTACYSCSGAAPALVTRSSAIARGCVKRNEVDCRPPVISEDRFHPTSSGFQGMIPSSGEGGGTIPFSAMAPGFPGSVPFSGEGGGMTPSFQGGVPFGGEGGGMAPGFQQGSVPFGGEGGGGDIRAPGGGIPNLPGGGGGMVPSGASLTGRRIRIVNRRP